ncbi:dihydrolipoamide acetyltransferase family protein [Metasolibacillus sp.]|uniref:dihydrolipoamide acetyltransferase family protein n=1 Tax=Metasolibacillus sp. TaxID=2703680 RepID=UPI0025EF7939|nr:dihydrolipoamide acetyltransferase family protein [Metasolibacillus sp.]MCT6922973.1 2-oxo acid dehydrogenase subunit E2 [Metasolibacillus sp.]MCT6939211.1 2-oxo acid dehydrogenase subunit E2 [Metasolibacillus sp.]
MAIQNIVMPQLGESVTEGTIERWLVKPGDKVNKYDPLAEVNTDKVNAEIPSSFEGIVSELIANEGETLPVGAIVCTIDVQGDVSEPSAEKTSNVSSAILNAGVQHKEETPAQPAAQQAMVKVPRDKARYSPAVLTLAAEHNIDLTLVQGSGVGGRITRKDIQAIIASGQIPTAPAQPVEAPAIAPSAPQAAQEPVQAPPAPVIPTAAGDVEIPVTAVRRAIANNMLRSKHEVPHAWMMMEVDVTNLVAYRDSLKNEFKRNEGFNLTYFAFFMKAISQALKEFPMMNSMWAGDKIIQKKDINLSIAVATEDALFVPVIKNVDEKSVKGIAREIHELSQLVRTGKLRSEHMQGGTFTVNNTGSFGSVQSMGIINYPQAAILQVEAIVKRPVIMEGNMFAARDMVNLCLSLDHRVLDGLVCGKFLNRVKEILENVNKETMSVY